MELANSGTNNVMWRVEGGKGGRSGLIAARGKFGEVKEADERFEGGKRSDVWRGLLCVCGSVYVCAHTTVAKTNDWVWMWRRVQQQQSAVRLCCKFGREGEREGCREGVTVRK